MAKDGKKGKAPKAPKIPAIELLEPLLARTFDLERLRPPLPLLTKWLSATAEFDAMELRFLEEARIDLLDNTDYWNEEELKMQFISVVIRITKFQKPFRVYYNRDIEAAIEGRLVKTEADMLLSTGIGDIIETPYFFLHEYKREKKYSGDPIGQMLGGMLIAQAKNNDGKPVYGCYVQGRYWYFSVLKGKEYVISNSYNSTEIEEAKQIIAILREIQVIFKEEVAKILESKIKK
jgi:hypothetical protein